MGRFVTNLMLFLMAITAITLAFYDIIIGFVDINKKLADPLKLNLILISFGALLAYFFQNRDESKESKEKLERIFLRYVSKK